MARLPVLFCLLFLIAGIRGDELDLGDALDVDPTVAPTPEKKHDPTVKPGDVPKPATLAPKADPKPATSAPKPAPKPHDDDGFDLGDALGGDEPTTQKPKPGHGGGGGGGGSFNDDELADGLPPNDPSGHDGKKSGRAMQPSSGGEEVDQGEGKQSMIAGVVSALGVAAVGAVSSFIAYQKKKLCFKGQAEDPENVNMDNQKDQNDPQVQTNLLSK